MTALTAYQDIVHSFTMTVGGVTKTRANGTTYDIPEYPAIVTAEDPDLFIAIYRHEGGRVRELHLLNRDGEWNGPSVQIYPPDLDYKYIDVIVWFVRPAYCSAGSSTTPSTAHTRAQSAMLNIAATLADLETEEERPRLEKEAAETTKKLSDERDKGRAKRDKNKNRMAELLKNYGNGPRVRVTGTDGVRRTGWIAPHRTTTGALSPYSFELIGGKVESPKPPRVISMEDVVLFEVKTGGRGQFQEITFEGEQHAAASKEGTR